MSEPTAIPTGGRRARIHDPNDRESPDLSDPRPIDEILADAEYVEPDDGLEES